MSLRAIVIGGRVGVEFRKYWLASAAWNLGQGVGQVAAPLLAASLTRDPVEVAGLTSGYRLPAVLFPLVAGVVVDRLNRGVLMVVTNALRFLLIGGLGVAVALGMANLPMLYVVFFLVGTLELLHDIAAVALLPSVASRELLERANSQLSASEFLFNDFGGRPLATMLFGIAAALPFALGAGAFAAAAAFVLTLVPMGRPAPAPAPSRIVSLRTVLSEVGEGIRWLARHRVLRTLALVLGVLNTMYAVTEGILVLFAIERLGLSSFGYGLLFSCTAVGGLLGSRLTEFIIARLGLGRALLLCVITEGWALGVMGLFHDAILAGTMFFLIGVESVVFAVIATSLRQAAVPHELLGRVGSVSRLLSGGGITLGALVGGLLADRFGLDAPFLAAAVVLTLTAVAAMPAFRNATVAAIRHGGGEQR